MPFTLAHPAAIVPLARVRWLAPLPLIVGSLAPDLFGFLMPFGFTEGMTSSHSFTGSLLVDLPFGYAFLLLIRMMQVPLTAPLWEPHRSFVRQVLSRYFARRSWWLVAVPSLLIGSWTHILWDSFTHGGAWGVQQFPLLQQTWWVAGEYPLAMHRLLQYGCSLFGLAVLGLWYGRSLRASGLRRAHGGRWRKALLSGAVALSVVAGTTAATTLPHTGGSLVYVRASVLSVVAMGSFALTYIAIGVVTTMWIAVKLRLARRSQR